LDLSSQRRSPVRPDELLVVFDLPSAIEHGIVLRPVPLDLLGRVELRIGRTDEIAARPSEETSPLLAHQEPAVRAVLHEDGCRDCVDHGVEECAVAPRGRLGCLATPDVLRDEHVTGDATVGPIDCRERCADEDHPAVVPAERQFEFPAAVRGDAAAQRGETIGHCDIGLVGHEEHPERDVDETPGRDADEPGRAVVDRRDRPLGIEPDDRVAGAVEQCALERGGPPAGDARPPAGR
jgi:hypothetical protein